jgi:hypothetical protein
MLMTTNTADVPTASRTRISHKHCSHPRTKQGRHTCRLNVREAAAVATVVRPAPIMHATFQTPGTARVHTTATLRVSRATKPAATSAHAA